MHHVSSLLLTAAAVLAGTSALSRAEQTPEPAPPPPAPAPAPDATAPVELKLKQFAFTRGDEISGKIVLAKPLTGGGKVTLTWSDCFNRTVAIQEEPSDAGEKDLSFELPAAPALALANTLTVDVDDNGTKLSANKTFVVTPDVEPWDDYQVIMYNSYKPEFQNRLRELGITAGMNQRPSRLLDESGEKTKIWWGYGYRFYAEQILSEVYAEYHRYQEEKPKNIRLMEAKELYKKDKTKKDAFFRKPCLSDPDVRKKIEETMRKAVELNAKFAPLFYSLADEAGIADLPTAWDFCYDPRTLAAMREWLKAQYTTVEGLNKEWGTAFATWDDVVPLTTDEMMKRGDDNLSPWADHRTFMEMVFADAVKWGVDATTKADPHAYCGLVGCQMPSAFGGYDYWRLSQTMTAIEPYNIGNNREIWRSFKPDAPALTTTFGYSPNEAWRLWYQLLHGDRGTIIYDEKATYLDDKGEPTELGKQAGGLYKQLTSGICKLLSNSTSVNDPIAIHYSQASIHAHWMFQARPEGEKWMERGSKSERTNSEFLRVRESFTKLIEDQQLQYTFVSYAQLERGDLVKNPPKVLLLPQSIAMSSAECAAVRAYVEAGGTVVADSRCALMDEHCKRLPKGQLDDLFGIKRANQDWKPGGKITVPNGELKIATVEPGISIDPDSKAKAAYADTANVPAVIGRDVGKGHAVYLNLDLTDYHRWRLKAGEGNDALTTLESIFNLIGIKPAITVSRLDGGVLSAVEVHTFANGAAKIIALHRNFQLRIDELGPPEYQSNGAFEKEEKIDINLGSEYAVYDSRTGTSLGNLQNIRVTLKPFEPLIFTLLPKPAKELTVLTSEKPKRGEKITILASLDAPAPADVHVFRMEVTGPDGKVIPYYSRNVKAFKGVASTSLYLALSEPAGNYTITLRDVATGIAKQKSVPVE